MRSLIQSDIRNYQHIGYSWIRESLEHNFCACSFRSFQYIRSTIPGDRQPTPQAIIKRMDSDPLLLVGSSQR